MNRFAFIFLASLVAMGAAATLEAETWRIRLFDGTTLQGWQGLTTE